MLTGKKILLGICGSIAAYKSALLCRGLVKVGAQVKVIMTESGTDFISPLTMATLSRHPVQTALAEDEEWTNHVELGLWADLYVVAPVTAHTLAKMANGMCDNMVTACYLSARCQTMIAPAMDIDMWLHPTTQRNVEMVVADGGEMIPVEEGPLASGLEGPGRMAEPAHIISAIEAHFKKKSDLAGVRAIVTAGPTYEDIDPVRFIGNRSSGKMGVAIVQALIDRGAEVDLVIGPTALLLPQHQRLRCHMVRSAAEMAECALKIWKKVDLAVLAAAVADYRPKHLASKKIKKADHMTKLDLERTEDIALSFAQVKKPHQITVGFALESEDGEEHARRKLAKKSFDLIVLNSLQDKGAGFQHDTNKVTFLTPDGEKVVFPLKSKTEVGEDIVDQITLLRKHITER